VLRAYFAPNQLFTRIGSVVMPMARWRHLRAAWLILAERGFLVVPGRDAPGSAVRSAQRGNGGACKTSLYLAAAASVNALARAIAAAASPASRL